MGVVPCIRVKDAEVIVEAFITSLNVAATVVFRFMPVDRFTGLVEMTSGQIPLSPASSITFLHPATSTSTRSKKDHLFFRILE